MLLNSIKPNQRIDEIIKSYVVNNIRIFITFDDKRLEYSINANQYNHQGPGGKVYLTSSNPSVTDMTVYTGDLDNWIIEGIADVFVITEDGYSPVCYTLTKLK